MVTAYRNLSNRLAKSDMKKGCIAIEWEAGRGQRQGETSVSVSLRRSETHIVYDGLLEARRWKLVGMRERGE